MQKEDRCQINSERFRKAQGFTPWEHFGVCTKRRSPRRRKSCVASKKLALTLRGPRPIIRDRFFRAGGALPGG